MKKLLTLLKLTLLFLLIANLLQIQAYTSTAGVQVGDTVSMEIEGVLENGTTFQPHSPYTHEISYSSGLIEGFVDGVLGMKISKTKTFSVPPDKGYPNGALAGLTLIFTVKVISVQGYTEPSESNTSTANNALETIGRILFGIGGAIAAIYVMFVLYNLISRQTGLKCETCGKPAAGTCSSCGHAFCREHFTGRCPSCGGKKFIPKKD